MVLAGQVMASMIQGPVFGTDQRFLDDAGVPGAGPFDHQGPSLVGCSSGESCRFVVGQDGALGCLLDPVVDLQTDLFVSGNLKLTRGGNVG